MGLVRRRFKPSLFLVEKFSKKIFSKKIFQKFGNVYDNRFWRGRDEQIFSRNFLSGKIFQKLILGEKFSRNLPLGR